MGEISAPLSTGSVAASVTWSDAEGNVTSPVDVPVWASSDESVATVEAAADGLSATVTLVAVGAANITSDTTNADGSVIQALGTVTVTPNPIASGDMEFTEGG